MLSQINRARVRIAARIFHRLVPHPVMTFRAPLLDILRAPGYRPVNDAALFRALKLPPKQRSRFLHELRLLLSRGEVTLVQGDRYTLPEPKRAAASSSASGKRAAPAPDDGSEVIGRIQFRAGGSAFVIPSFDPEADADAPRPDGIQINAGDSLTALPGDTVAVEIDASLRGRRFASGDSRNSEPRGRVVRIVERARTEVVGRLAKVRTQYVVLADDPRFPLEVFVADPGLSRLKPAPKIDDKVVASLEPWEDPRKPLRGVVTEVLGKTFEPRAELLGVYRKFNLEPAFPVEVEREVASLPDRVQPAQLKGRLDYRDSAVFTIDPDDAKDFDDALSIESLPEGGLRVGVHIADVSAYVKPGTALDKEALKRGNSTYLVGTVVPMLPEKLSNGLCSLVEAQDRLCKACFLEFDAKGRLQPGATTFADTVIRSRKRLTYKQAYAMLFTDSLQAIRELPLPPKHQTGSTGRALSSLSDRELGELQEHTRTLWKLASRLRRDRMAAGSLDLDMPETKVFVDEQGYADRLERIEHDESHQLIEEFMLAANESVARLTRREKLPSVYRVHDDPDAEKLDELRQQLATHGVRVSDLSERKELIRLLKLLEDHPQGYTLRTQLLRSLRKAAYRSAPDGHFGLNKKDYTHFTSPIRRYSDLVVHRVLAVHFLRQAGEKKAKLPYTAGKAQEMGEHLSLTEVNSAEAERESVKIKLLEFFERELLKKEPTRFEAVITDVRPNGLFIELTESMTFGFVPAAALQDDFYQITNDGSALVGRKTKNRYASGAKIFVHIHKVDRVKRLMDFRPVVEKPSRERRG